ncbi:methyltransferase domain-containing protein [candidate division WOR-3 bacterium]|uniref:Methyltransferase domain-containing protein n=1 Tax=candidate division WOR-3 bacterium TaxID=2052148 RepID=A0A9D5K892_UNCW3|nr:methyltransferase domain-containing protein [candidate division WOR-3 bacterium]MBD3364248.1 methyltransferase domain-containing protein [candidate division WOR-3 bacterium]
MSSIPIMKPTETEKLIWTRNTPKRTGGLVRNEAFVFRHVLQWPEWFREPDKLNPDDWERKLLAGCRGEWFAHIVEGRIRILDVGSGFGFPSFYLARYGHEVVGVDPSTSEIATANKLASNIKPRGKVSFRVIEESSFPFPDNSFDAATLSTSLECVADPEFTLGELKRVLKPGSPLAIEEEDRSVGPDTHPVWEKSSLTFFDDAAWLWYELRIKNPHMDRRYMIQLDASGTLAPSIRELKQIILSKNRGLPTIDIADTGVSLQEILSVAGNAQYSEARGYDPSSLCQLLNDTGFSDIRFYSLPNGREFASSLKSYGLLESMPDDVRGILRALVESAPRHKTPDSTVVSCRTP